MPEIILFKIIFVFPSIFEEFAFIFFDIKFVELIE
jgi:hypothetical protein